MKIITASIRVLEQLRNSISHMSNQEFTSPVISLNGSTIGQHCRHTIEFFTCLMDGYHSGRLDYDKRERKIEIESDTETSIDTIDSIILWLQGTQSDRPLTIDITYDEDGVEHDTLNTTYFRELVYNIEHAIHHMALIKVGIREICPEVPIDDSYGVAVSTLRYQRSKSTTQHN